MIDVDLVGSTWTGNEVDEFTDSHDGSTWSSNRILRLNESLD